MARHLSKSHKKAISEGLRRHHRKKGRRGKKKYTKAQRRAFKRSRTSKSDHKSYKARLREKRPGLWANYWNKVKSGYGRRMTRKKKA